MTRARMLAAVVLAAALFVPVAAQQPRPYRILITNDDGVRAPALAILADALKALGEVTIVAPSGNQTAKSQSLNTLEPIFREDIQLPNGLPAIGLSATPATTVQVGIKNILPTRPDVVVSGINPGYNFGFSAYLSGTVGAARQAVMEGVPAVAASLAAAAAPRDYAAAAAQVAGVVRRIQATPLPPLTFLNVNIPAMPAGGYKGYQVTTPAPMRAGVESFAEAKHPTGRTVYWSVYREEFMPPEGSDGWAVANGFVAVTPLRVGEYDAAAAAAVRAAFR